MLGAAFFAYEIKKEELSCGLNPGGLAWLLDHPIRSRQHIRRDSEVDLVCSFEIYHELKLRWLLHGKVSRLSALQDFVNVSGGPAVEVGPVRSIGHQPSVVYELPIPIDRR